MERFLKKYDKECMKMAMLKHEETFRHQVNELHRLYRVQKLLMNDMKSTELKRQRMPANSRTGFEQWNSKSETASHQRYQSYREQWRPRRTLDLELPAEEYIGKDDGDVILEAEQESDLELTLAIGSSRRKKKEASFTSDSGGSFSSSSAESGGVKLNGDEWRLYQVPEVNMSFQSERMSDFDLTKHMREEGAKHPPWLFQCLSLNMT